MSNDSMQTSALQTSAAGTPTVLVERDALVALCTAVLPVWARHLATSRSQSEAAVTEMLSAFAEIGRVMAMIKAPTDAPGNVAQPFEHETQMVSQQVDRMYVGFQYQDRISQMLTLLHDDIQRLTSVMAAPAANSQALAPEDWLARLESRYAMAEQHHDHGKAVLSGVTPTPNSNIETTFF